MFFLHFLLGFQQAEKSPLDFMISGVFENGHVSGVAVFIVSKQPQFAAVLTMNNGR